MPISLQKHGLLLAASFAVSGLAFAEVAAPEAAPAAPAVEPVTAEPRVATDGLSGAAPKSNLSITEQMLLEEVNHNRAMRKLVRDKERSKLEAEVLGLELQKANAEKNIREARSPVKKSTAQILSPGQQVNGMPVGGSMAQFFNQDTANPLSNSPFGFGDEGEQEPSAPLGHPVVRSILGDVAEVEIFNRLHFVKVGDRLDRYRVAEVDGMFVMLMDEDTQELSRHKVQWR